MTRCVTIVLIETLEVPRRLVGRNEQSALVKDYYREVIREVMKANRVNPLVDRPDYELSPDAGITEVLQYTDSFVAGTHDTEDHYRYNRYIETLNLITASKARQVHVDIGCGAGLFSWAFLDWATANGLEHKRTRLFGLDHNQASLRLAKQIRKRLRSAVSDYPNLHYYRRSKKLTRSLRENHLKGSDYVITFGHVLEQAHDPEEIEQFSDVISSVLDVLEPGCNCTVIVVDAFEGQRRKDLERGWSRLRDNLDSIGIDVSEWSFRYSSLNPSGSRRLASLSRQS